MFNKLSDVFGREKELTDNQISNIVFDGIIDEGKKCKYAIVFGSPNFQKYRIEEAVRLYKAKRIQKLILAGGIGRKTDASKVTETEASQMRKIALANGVSEEDIILEDKSTTTIENCLNVVEILGKELYELKDMILISSEWHLKRCLAIAMKYLSKDITYYFALGKDGVADRAIWQETMEGRSIVERELNILTKHAKQERIYDLNIKI